MCDFIINVAKNEVVTENTNGTVTSTCFTWSACMFCPALPYNGYIDMALCWIHHISDNTTISLCTCCLLLHVVHTQLSNGSFSSNKALNGMTIKMSYLVSVMHFTSEMSHHVPEQYKCQIPYLSINGMTALQDHTMFLNSMTVSLTCKMSHQSNCIQWWTSLSLLLMFLSVNNTSPTTSMIEIWICGAWCDKTFVNKGSTHWLELLICSWVCESLVSGTLSLLGWTPWCHGAAHQTRTCQTQRTNNLHTADKCIRLNKWQKYVETHQTGNLHKTKTHDQYVKQVTCIKQVTCMPQKHFTDTSNR